jgi:hypothetical protein
MNFCPSQVAQHEATPLFSPEPDGICKKNSLNLKNLRSQKSIIKIKLIHMVLISLS